MSIDKRNTDEILCDLPRDTDTPISDRNIHNFYRSIMTRHISKSLRNKHRNRAVTTEFRQKCIPDFLLVPIPWVSRVHTDVHVTSYRENKKHEKCMLRYCFAQKHRGRMSYNEQFTVSPHTCCNVVLSEVKEKKNTRIPNTIAIVAFERRKKRNRIVKKYTQRIGRMGICHVDRSKRKNKHNKSAGIVDGNI